VGKAEKVAKAEKVGREAVEIGVQAGIEAAQDTEAVMRTKRTPATTGCAQNAERATSPDVTSVSSVVLGDRLLQAPGV